MGVIIGNDLRYENNKIICDATKRARTDQSMRGLRKMEKDDPEASRREAEEIIKNTYRVLLSRGMKGCYVFCMDRALSEYLKMRLRRCQRNDLYAKDINAMIELD